MRLWRSSTLCAAGVVSRGDASAAEPLAVDVVVRPVGDGLLVLGRVCGRVRRACDRCCAGFWEGVDRAAFELWLDCGAGGGEDAEAVEEFVGARARVDLAGHVRDAVLLGLATRAVCGERCVGVGGGGGVLDRRGACVGWDGGGSGVG